MKKKSFLISVVLIALITPLKLFALNIDKGVGKYVYTNPSSKQKTNVFYFIPENLSPSSPVIMTFHGIRRNANDYRDAWKDLANQYGYIILATQVSAKDYPGVNGYNMGNVMLDKDKLQLRDSKEWSFHLVDEVLNDFQANIHPGHQGKRYVVGHSAGCQFTHRLLFFKPETKAELFICSSSGWYTFPDENIIWPYGLKATGKTQEDLKASWQRPVVMAVGSADTDTKHKYLRRTPEAQAQGKNRFERLNNFYDANKAAAEKLGATFNWIKRIAPDVGHNSVKISAWAANFIHTLETTGKYEEQAEFEVKSATKKPPVRISDEDDDF